MYILPGSKKLALSLYIQISLNLICKMSALYWYIALTGVGILNDEKKSKIVDTSWNLSATKFIYYRDSLIAVEPYGVFGHFWTYNTTWILILHDLMRISALLDNLLIFTHETWTCCCMEHLKRHTYFSDFFTTHHQLITYSKWLTYVTFFNYFEHVFTWYGNSVS